jgi:hypothetical protein
MTVDPAVARRVLGRWQLEGPRDVPGLQDERVVRAMWAFALEEAGDIDRAGEVARAVLAEDPTGECEGSGPPVCGEALWLPARLLR